MSRQKFALSYEIAPIILVNGVASNQPNGLASILLLTEGRTDPNYSDLQQYFGRFKPVAGGTLIDYSPATYPFASMVMAANAMLKNALKISMLMECPARSGSNSYPSIQAIMTRVKQQLDAHILQGGTFTVATPGFVYENCLLLGLHDVSSAGDKKVQGTWQFDFLQPLITQQEAQQQYNAIMNKLAGGLPVSNPPTNSGLSTSIGNAQANQSPTRIGPPGLD